MVAVLVLFYITNEAIKNYENTAEKLVQAEKDYLKVSTELQSAEVQLGNERGKVTRLERQLKDDAFQIALLKDNVLVLKDKLFVDEMAKQIEADIAQGEPGRPLGSTDHLLLCQYIRASINYQDLYKKKYPKYAENFNWKTMLRMMWVEDHLALDPKKGAAGELGAPQICESNKNKDGSEDKYLYHLLCRLGYKRSNYQKTIWDYRKTPRIQVHCMYEHFLGKLRDQDGLFTAAVVAYNSASSFPEKTAYWASYMGTRSRMQKWINLTLAGCK